MCIAESTVKAMSRIYQEIEVPTPGDLGKRTTEIFARPHIFRQSLFDRLHCRFKYFQVIVRLGMCNTPSNGCCHVECYVPVDRAILHVRAICGTISTAAAETSSESLNVQSLMVLRFYQYSILSNLPLIGQLAPSLRGVRRTRDSEQLADGGPMPGCSHISDDNFPRE